MSDSDAFDLDEYLAHIGAEGARRPDTETLRAVHLAHMRGIPFENLDALRHTAPSLELPDLTAKLLRSRAAATATSRTRCWPPRCGHWGSA